MNLKGAVNQPLVASLAELCFLQFSVVINIMIITILLLKF